MASSAARSSARMLASVPSTPTTTGSIDAATMIRLLRSPYGPPRPHRPPRAVLPVPSCRPHCFGTVHEAFAPGPDRTLAVARPPASSAQQEVDPEREDGREQERGQDHQEAAQAATQRPPVTVADAPGRRPGRPR